MSQEYQRGGARFRWLAAALLVLAVPAALAQYPGQIDVKKQGPTLRSIAILEWVGEPGKPSASRLIPIAVYDGQNFQPGGLYLARPEPLAVQPGTEYILEKAGHHSGIFDIGGAADVQGYWVGYGDWKPIEKPSSHGGTAKTKKTPELDPGRPHLHYDTNSQTGSQTGSQTSAQTSQPAAPVPPASKQPTPSAVPGRPVLRHRSPSSSAGDAGFLPAGPESESGSLIPGRPHLSYGSKNTTQTNFELPKLTGAPPHMEQMVAVSDAANLEPQTFLYSWANPEDAGKMRAAMEKIAIADLTASAPKPLNQSAPTRRSAKRRRRGARHATRHATPKLTPIQLTKERFQSYGLTYSGGATLVLTAQTVAPPGKARYITLIAQPDFYGVPQVVFQSITDDDSLDETPRMKLIDAVDAEGNHRGDLLFELSSRDSRQFAIYQVTRGQVQQLFTTGPLGPGLQ